jgi:CHAT domain
MGGERFECKLKLLDAEHVQYSDNRHLDETFPEDLDADSLHTETAAWLARSLRERAEFCAAEGLRLLGHHLYERVFRGKVEEAFRSTVTEYEKLDREKRAAVLRLEIIFSPDAEMLAELPWEFLYDPTAQGFLADKYTLVLTRVVPGVSELVDGPVAHPKILLAVCTPEGTAAGTTKELGALLGEAHRDKKLELTSLSDPTYTMVESALRKKPHILHLIGHGTPGALKMRRDPERIKEAEAERAVAQSSGRAVAPVEKHEEIGTTKAEQLFKSFKPRLVFIQTCSGAAVGKDVLHSTALDIARCGVPAVVAMQYDIGAEEADRFAAAFYTSLISGSTIGEAVSAGRRVLAQREGTAWDHRDFGTPVVYVENDREVVEVSSDGASKTSALRKCPRCDQSVKWSSCARCRLRLDCPCAGNDDVDCSCSEELEVPGSGFCAACEHSFDQPQWDPGLTQEREPAREGSVVPLDGYEAAS